MYSATSECLNYLKRVASHATKESPTGRIDAIPWWAGKPEANTLIEEYRILSDRRNTEDDLRLRRLFENRRGQRGPEYLLLVQIKKYMKQVENTEWRLQKTLDELKVIKETGAPDPKNRKAFAVALRKNIQTLTMKQKGLEMLWLDFRLGKLQGIEIGREWKKYLNEKGLGPGLKRRPNTGYKHLNR
jgi:hypothetical protein